MKEKKLIRFFTLAFVALLLLLIDLVTKIVAEELVFSQPAYFLGIVRLYFTKNTGIAFGMFSDNAVGMTVITVVTVVMIALIGVAVFTVFKSNFAAQLVLAVIEAGAVGNLIDRLALGYVRDFVDVSPLGFGICNIADFYITFGAVVLLFILLFIGPGAVFPLKKKWREEAKQREEAKARETHHGQDEKHGEA